MEMWHVNISKNFVTIPNPSKSKYILFFHLESDPYCYIKCEGETARSHAVENSLNPSWEFTAIFYRKDVSKPITIQIWNSNLVVDSFMGQAFVLAEPDAEYDPTGESKTIIRTLNLVGKKKSGEHETLTGEVKFEYETYENLYNI